MERSYRHGPEDTVYQRIPRGGPLFQRSRLSSLSVWWVRLGIYPEHTDPASPGQNACHERMHRTLKEEATIPPEKDIRTQQARFDRFRREYNEIRPHDPWARRCPSIRYHEEDTREIGIVRLSLPGAPRERQ